MFHLLSILKQKSVSVTDFIGCLYWKRGYESKSIVRKLKALVDIPNNKVCYLQRKIFTVI